MRSFCFPCCLFAVLLFLAGQRTGSAQQQTLQERLQAAEGRLIFETYEADNWELATINGDGTDRRLLTNTPNVHELYPQVSPDGTKVCFVVDSGTGRALIRSVWIMDIDGGNRRKIADYARQPCWAPDSRTVVFLPQEYKKFNIADYFTKGLVFYDTQTGKSKPHVNSGALHHLYNVHFAPNGKWLIATVHAGMGYSHSTLLIEADGDKIINLGDGLTSDLAGIFRQGKTGESPSQLSGCRPCVSPDSKKIAWGRTDHHVTVAEIDLDSKQPKITKVLMQVHDPKNKIYHVDWSPTGKFLSISRGLSSKGDLTKPGTHEAACEMVGVYARNWDIIAVSATESGTVELSQPSSATFHQVTRDGASNKESDWYLPAK